MEGRSILENIHFSQELIRQYNQKRVSTRCLIKIDLSKVYDSISWPFLHDVLIRLGFSPKFVGYILDCVTAASYSIQINGDVHGFFGGRRGLR